SSGPAASAPPATRPTPPTPPTTRPTAAPATASGPAPTPLSELSALSSHVAAGVAAGSVAGDTGAAVTKDARQAVTDYIMGEAGPASSDLQRAVKSVAAGIDDGSITSPEAQLLETDLSALASTLGVSAGPVSANAPAPRPTGRHRHHGGG